MEIRKDGHIVWEKVDRSHERDTFEKIAGLDAICFNGKAYERLTADTHIYGDIYALKVNGSAVGYAIYGQEWRTSRCYISRIVHPEATTRVRTQDTRSSTRQPIPNALLLTQTSGAISPLNASLESWLRAAGACESQFAR